MYCLSAKYIYFPAGKRTLFLSKTGSGIGLLVSTMATKIKGIYKSFKFISQIFGNFTHTTLFLIYIIVFAFSITNM